MWVLYAAQHWDTCSREYGGIFHGKLHIIIYEKKREIILLNILILSFFSIYVFSKLFFESRGAQCCMAKEFFVVVVKLEDN